MLVDLFLKVKTNALLLKTAVLILVCVGRILSKKTVDFRCLLFSLSRSFSVTINSNRA